MGFVKEYFCDIFITDSVIGWKMAVEEEELPRGYRPGDLLY